MADSGEAIVSCSRWQELPGAYNRIKDDLTLETRERMTQIMFNYMARFGPQGVFERMNNRSVSRILAEFEPGQVKVIESDEVEGLRYHLYEKPIEGKTGSGESGVESGD